MISWIDLRIARLADIDHVYSFIDGRPRNELVKRPVRSRPELKEGYELTLPPLPEDFSGSRPQSDAPRKQLQSWFFPGVQEEDLVDVGWPTRNIVNVAQSIIDENIRISTTLSGSVRVQELLNEGALFIVGSNLRFTRATDHWTKRFVVGVRFELSGNGARQIQRAALSAVGYAFPRAATLILPDVPGIRTTYGPKLAEDLSELLMLATNRGSMVTQMYYPYMAASPDRAWLTADSYTISVDDYSIRKSLTWSQWTSHPENWNQNPQQLAQDDTADQAAQQDPTGLSLGALSDLTQPSLGRTGGQDDPSSQDTNPILDIGPEAVDAWHVAVNSNLRILNLSGQCALFVYAEGLSKFIVGVKFSFRELIPSTLNEAMEYAARTHRLQQAQLVLPGLHDSFSLDQDMLATFMAQFIDLDLVHIAYYEQMGWCLTANPHNFDLDWDLCQWPALNSSHRIG